MSDDAGSPIENDPQSWQPDWVIDLPETPVVTVADGQKDEFIHHLFDFMRQEYDHGYSSQTRYIGSNDQRVAEWKLNTADDHELPRLWVISESGTLRLYVVGQG